MRPIGLDAACSLMSAARLRQFQRAPSGSTISMPPIAGALSIYGAIREKKGKPPREARPTHEALRARSTASSTRQRVVAAGNIQPGRFRRSGRPTRRLRRPAGKRWIAAFLRRRDLLPRGLRRSSGPETSMASTCRIQPLKG